MTDIEAIWLGQGSELARRMLALADDLAAIESLGTRIAAGRIRDVLNCDENPLPDRPVELGDPPTALRPAVPPAEVLKLPPPLAEHTPHRGLDPGA